MTKVRLKKLICFFEDDSPGWLGEVNTNGNWLTVTGVYRSITYTKLALLEYVTNVVWEGVVTEKIYRSKEDS
jgi:hypothetical protein